MRRGIKEKLVFNSISMSCLFLATLVLYPSCSKSASSGQDPATMESVVYASTGNGVRTRTIAGGPALDGTLWSEKDRISFFYRPQGTGDALAQSVMGVYRIYPDETVFTGNVESLPDTYYDCFAAYPVPESVSGTVAVFDLPAVQNGLYDSGIDGTSHDIMVAAPVSDVAFSGEGQVIPLDFVHKCHAFRIQIPEGRNLFGMDVKKLKVEFPAEVTGKLSVDLSAPASEPLLSEGSSTVWLDLTKVLKESETDSPDGSYAWIFTAPVDIDGEVRFTAYSRENYRSESISVSLTKTLEAGKITPVTLTVPAEPEYSSVMLKVGANNLGEDYMTVTVKAPEGAVFRNGASAVTFGRNEAQEYPIEFYESVDGVENLTPMKSGDLTVEFESEHAIVSCEPISLADFTWGETGRTFDRDVPYLLYEDFSGATERNGDNQTEMLDSYNLPGWSASNYSISAGQCLRIHMYAGTISALGEGDIIYGRVDSPALGSLKDGAEVTLSVSYDVGGTSASGINSTLYALYSFGNDVRSGAVAASDSIGTEIIKDEDPGTDGSYTDLPLHKSVELAGATRDDRLSWRTAYRYYRGAFGSITSKTVYIYIDNIKVQIAPQKEAEE